MLKHTNHCLSMFILIYIKPLCIYATYVTDILYLFLVKLFYIYGTYRYGFNGNNILQGRMKRNV